MVLIKAQSKWYWSDIYVYLCVYISPQVLFSHKGRENKTVLWPFKARQVHGIHADGKIFMEPLGCLACLYSRVSESRMLQAACLSACLMSRPLLPCGTHCGTCPLACLSSSLPHAGIPYLSKYWRGTKLARCQKLYNIILHMQVQFMLWEQFIGPSLKAMGTLLPSVAQIPEWGSQTASTHPTRTKSTARLTLALLFGSPRRNANHKQLSLDDFGYK